MTKWVVLFLYLFVVLGMVNEKRETIPCRAIDARVLDSVSVQFVSENDLSDLVLNQYGKILGSPISQVISEEIEKLAENNPFVARAEVYKDVEGVLHLNIIQRHPVARIVSNSVPDMYIDKEGFLLPSPDIRKPVYVLVVSGNTSIQESMISQSVMNFPEDHPLKGVYRIAAYIDSSQFWKNQIEQIFIDRGGEFWLAPRAGAHRILLGSPENYHWKFRKLYLLYTHGLNNVGWNRYETINLKFSNQVICIKRK